jgi:hypothetical protein
LDNDWTNGTGYQNDTSKSNNGVTWDNPKSGSYFWTSSSKNKYELMVVHYILLDLVQGGSWLYESGSAQYIVEV